MFDTINFRLLGALKHKEIWERIFRNAHDCSVDYRTILFHESVKNPFPSYEFEYAYNSDSGKPYMTGGNAQMFNASHSYKWRAVVRPKRDFVEFEMSIPKYLWGQNIVQFVRSSKNKLYKIEKYEKWNNHMREAHENLLNFLHFFFHAQFFGCSVDYANIEIVRLDICFNQVFLTKDEALRFLDYKKNIRVKNMRFDCNNLQQYGTAISYHTKSWSFKIYHKGTEYRKTGNMSSNIYYNNTLLKDRRKIEEFREEGRVYTAGSDFDLTRCVEKNSGTYGAAEKKYFDEAERIYNNVYRKGFFDVDYLERFADKILRYEITFRNAEMSYIYNNKLRGSENMEYRIDLAKYKKLKTIVRSKDIFAIRSKDQDFYTRMDKKINAVRRFMMYPDKFMIDSELSGRDHSNETHFSPRMLKQMFLKFANLCKDFRVTEITKVNEVQDKIRIHNRRWQRDREKFSVEQWRRMSRKNQMKFIGTKINESRILGYYNSLMRYGSLEKWRQFENIDPRAMRKIRVILKNFGIDNSTVSNHVSEEAEMTFKRYYNEETFNYTKLRVGWNVSNWL